MNDRARPYLFALAAAVVVGAVGFGIVYDNRQPKQSVQVVKLPPADYSAPGFAPGSDGASATGDSAEDSVRPAAAAGQYYPADRQELAATVERLLDEAQPPEDDDPKNAPFLVISPHAGYEYSGHLAARAVSTMADRLVERVILVGRSHNETFSQVAADDHDYWQTPLGRVSVDDVFIKRLSQDSGIIVRDRSVHKEEHSLEVMVPLLQSAIGRKLRIVPLLFGGDEPTAAAALGRSLSRLIDRRTVVIVSTDLSHYPTKDEAETVDAQTVAAITAGDPDRWRQSLAERQAAGLPENTQTLACAAPAVEAGLHLAKRLGLESRELGYCTSADRVPESADRAVGYMAAAFYGQLPELAPRSLTPAEKTRALQVARQAIENLFTGEETIIRPAFEETIFDQRLGAFVTLKRSGQLRGCIGLISPSGPLDETIRQSAVSAAAADSRFQPLQAEERAELEIEVSVLSPLRSISGPDEIELGTHGVWLANGVATGVFLPQVATESGWIKRERLLGELCSQKAGLSPDCWQDPETVIKVFTAEVFSEPYYP